MKTEGHREETTIFFLSVSLGLHLWLIFFSVFFLSASLRFKTFWVAAEGRAEEYLRTGLGRFQPVLATSAG
jgi:hypothetical protein